MTSSPIGIKWNLTKSDSRLYCGEFGCIAATPKADKERWYQDMIELFDKYEIARANWDYKGGFGIIEQGIPQTDLIYILTGRNIK